MIKIIKQLIFFAGLLNIFDIIARYVVALMTENTLVEYISGMNRTLLIVLFIGYIFFSIYLFILAGQLTNSNNSTRDKCVKKHKKQSIKY